MVFNFYDKNNKLKQLNIVLGQEWSVYKEKDNAQSLINSVFELADINSDGKVDKEELDILQKLLKLADSQVEKTKNNNIIENEELELLVDKIKNRELETLQENKPPSLITPKIIEIPRDKDKFTNYTYLSTFLDDDDNIKALKITVDYSSLNNLQEGQYYIESWDYSWSDEKSSGIFTPFVRKIQDSNLDGTTNWSEGINRNISKIQFANSSTNSKLIPFMNKVGAEQGFLVESLDIDGEALWMEDQSIIRSDKKQLIPNCDTNNADVYEKQDKIIAKRSHISLNMQGSAFEKEQPFTPSVAIKYSHTVSQDDIIEGKTYLEGGNVLNTLTKNGEPAAVIGEESIKYSMIKLGLDDSEESIKIAKKQIAEELGIKEEYVTYIPQFDFHIDMFYRPMNDGQIAIPDYEAGINVLNELIQNIDKDLDSPDIQPEQKNNLENKKEEYLKLINKLEEMKNNTAEIAKSAENELRKKDYEIVKIPCFTEIDTGRDQRLNARTVENPINYMNAICGTSAKTGDKFYITNTSGDEALDKYMENYFKEVIGFDKVYFAPTKKFLYSLGGIDCLTKEL